MSLLHVNTGSAPGSLTEAAKLCWHALPLLQVSQQITSMRLSAAGFIHDHKHASKCCSRATPYHMYLTDSPHVQLDPASQQDMGVQS